MAHHPVASIQLPWSEERNVDGLNEAQLFQKLNDLASPAYLMASLTASGSGWCAPSETIYTFACEVEAPPEELDLPTTTTSRGGQRYPISPTYSDFRRVEDEGDIGLFSWTEDDDRAAATGEPTKPCFHIPCVEFDEARLVIQGLCVTSGNMMDKAYPELQRRYMSLVLNAHLHRMNRLRILAAVAFADDHVTAPATFAAASQFLAQLELQVQDLRDQFSMSEGALVEAMAPRWLRGPIRADVARRDYGGNLNAVSNAEIVNYLQASGIRLQFVTDWQELGDPSSPAEVWPTEVDFLVWIPGALRRLTGPTLDIAVARDSVQNSTNDFTLAMTEESWKVYKPGCGVRLVTIPFCPSGEVGDRTALVCS
jgi:hypothetical protein